MSTDFVLAHLSDVHLAPLPYFALRHWNLKRWLGFLNWQRRRRYEHRREALAKLTEDLHRQTFDHIAVTGDLANLGMPVELEAGLRWLETLGPPERVSVIPGNHDIYTPLYGDPGIARWRAFMTSDRDTGRASNGDGFPFIRRFGSFSVIGVNSAVETPLGYATGQVDADQLARLDAMLEEEGSASRCRIVLIHHPPLPGQASHRRALLNAEDVANVLGERGAELVLHGHNHRNMLAWHPTRRGGPVPVIGVPSASIACTYGGDKLARYNLYRVSWDGETAHIRMTGRGLRAADGEVEELECRELAASDRTGPVHATIGRE